MPNESAMKARPFGAMTLEPELERMALGDAINLLLYGAGVGVDIDGNLKNHSSN